MTVQENETDMRKSPHPPCLASLFDWQLAFKLYWSSVSLTDSGVVGLLGALKKFSFVGPLHPLSVDIYFKTLISVVFTDSSGAP